MSIDLMQLHEIAKQFSELEFFNSHTMSVCCAQNNKKSEIIVYLTKKIRTDNLPKEFEGVKVSYRYNKQGIFVEV